jgi:hypothetical protein
MVQDPHFKRAPQTLFQIFVSAATSFVKNALAFFLQYKKFVNSKPQKNMEKDQYIIFTQTKSTSS